MKKWAGSEMKYKNLDEYITAVQAVDEQDKQTFLNTFNDLVTTLNELETADEKTSNSDLSIQALTNRIQDLIASVSTETLLRWFGK